MTNSTGVYILYLLAEYPSYGRHVSNFLKILQKKGVALPRPQDDPASLKKILKIFIDHDLHDGEGNLEKGPTLIFAEKRAWPCHAPQGDPTSLKKI